MPPFLENDMTPTVIRCDVQHDLIVTVISVLPGTDVWVHTYTVAPDGRTSLELSEVWGSEVLAIQRFYKLIR